MIQVACFGIVASLVAMKIKALRPEIGLVIGIVSSILLAIYGLNQMEHFFDVLENIRSVAGIPKEYIQILLKLVGISFLCEFVSNICKDAGQATIGKQVEFVGKLSILIVSLPVFEELMKIILNLLGSGE